MSNEICKSVDYLLTNREDICIRFLSNKMEATASMVGSAIWEHKLKGGSNLQGIGSAVLGRLKKKRLVMRLPELNAWRLTKEGREYVRPRNQ